MELIGVLVTLLLVAFPAVYLLLRVSKRSHFTKTVDMIPGPSSWPIVGSALHIIGVSREDLFEFIDQHSRKYQPIFRTWSGPMASIHTMHPDHFEVVMNNSTHIEKPLFYSFLHAWLGQGLLTATGKRWHSHRKLITPTFHFKILESFTEVFAEKSEILVQKLRKEVNGKWFNIYPYITRCTLDIICDTAMGINISAQEDTDSAYVTAVHETSEILMSRSLRPWFYPDVTFYMSAEGKKFKKHINILHGFTNKIIQERKKAFQQTLCSTTDKSSDDLGLKKRMAFLDLLLQASDNGKLLSDTDIREEVDTFMFEGHDTTAAGIGWALFLLGAHPEVQEKVFQELEEIFQGSDRHPTLNDLQEMKYLERVIKETLRLYPSVPIIGRFVREEMEFGEYKIPAGCMVWLQIYHTHRLEEFYPNPEQFDPDRFLPERSQGRHPYAYVPFSAGPRNCVGQKFAMFEEKTVLSSILRHYKLKSRDKMGEIKVVAELVLKPQKGIFVTLEAR